MKHGQVPKNAVALAMAIAVLASVLASMGRPAPVAADLGDGHTRANPRDEFTELDRAERGRITRNLVKGESLKVCSDVFPKATERAIERWNDRLPGTVLTFKGASNECQRAPSSTSTDWVPEDGVVSVFVSLGQRGVQGDRIGGRELPHDREYTCSDAAYACVRQDDVGDDDWRTRYGRMEVIVNPEKFCHDIPSPSTASCMQDDDDLLHMITHELGHALSLGDYFCELLNDAGDQHPDFIDVKTIMDSRWRPACDPMDGSPTDRDVEDYVTIYTPKAVVVEGPDVEGPEVDGQTVILHWSQADVFVESDFEIQRKSGPTWEVEEIVDPNEETITLTNQPRGEQHYRIRARTLALCPDEGDCGPMRKHFYGEPSKEIEVAVQFLAPANVQVTSRTATSLTVAWETVNGADRYELRQTTPDVACKDATREEDQEGVAASPPHKFSNLNPDTEYRLCVRATLSANGDVASEWAHVDARTFEELELTTSLKRGADSCYTRGNVLVNWNVSGGSGDHTVTVGNTDVTTSPTTVRCKSTAGPQSVTVTVTDDTADSTRSKRLTWMVNTRSVDPGTPPCPSGLNCLSSRQPASRVTWQACCTAVQASWLVDQLPRVCGIFLSRNGQRLIYGKTTSGIVIPGSEDFTILGGDRPWLYGCASSNAPSASPPGPSGAADGDFLDE